MYIYLRLLKAGALKMFVIHRTRGTLLWSEDQRQHSQYFNYVNPCMPQRVQTYRSPNASRIRFVLL